jgi:predicted transcriptional regulator
MNQLTTVLINLGLSENEVKVYTEAIKHEKVAPYAIAKAVGIPRTTVYDVMLNLALKGLITIKQNHGLEKQQTWIIAKNPSTLRNMIFKQRKELAALEVDLIDILPLLKGEYSKHVQNSSFLFYPGIEGAKQVMKQNYATQGNETIRVYESLMPMDTLGKQIINSDVDVGLSQQRTTNASIKSLVVLNKWTKHALSYQHARNADYVRLHNFRYMENPLLAIDFDLTLIGDSVRGVCAQDDEAWGFIMKSRKLSHTLQTIFDVLWTYAIPLTEKDIVEWGANEFSEAGAARNLRKKTIR